MNLRARACLPAIVLYHSLPGFLSDTLLGVLPPSSLLASAVPLVSTASPVTTASHSPVALSWAQMTPPLVSSAMSTTPPLPSALPPSVSTSFSSAVGVPVSSPPMVPSYQGNLSLSLSMDPIPAKLVARIQEGQFVEMRDLLGDNIALTQHFEAINNCFPSQVLPASSRPQLCEVTSLPSWIYCFLTYLAVRSSDQATRERLIYAKLLVREALRHGGRGWLDYDRLF